jgi:hypothetical protein
MKKQELELFYDKNQCEIEDRWAIYLSEGEFGSGEDYVNPDTEERFWEFVEDLCDTAGGLV